MLLCYYTIEQILGCNHGWLALFPRLVEQFYFRVILSLCHCMLCNVLVFLKNSYVNLMLLVETFFGKVAMGIKVFHQLFGIKFTDANKAFICKLGWKIIHETNNLWVQTIQAKYLKQLDFFSVSIKSRDSLVWKNIPKQRPLLRKGIRWIVYSGDEIFFWYDNWVFQYSIVDFLQLNINSLPFLDLKVSQCIISKRSWDVGFLKIIVPSVVVDQILTTPLPDHELRILLFGLLLVMVSFPLSLLPYLLIMLIKIVKILGSLNGFGS